MLAVIYYQLSSRMLRLLRGVATIAPKIYWCDKVYPICKINVFKTNENRDINKIIILFE